MPHRQTEADFEEMSWHDCSIWRVDLQVGDAEQNDWTSDLVIGLDFITEWLCGVDKRVRFKVAPARLTFHGVTDPSIGIDWGHGSQTAISLISIDHIEREPIADQKIFLDRPYYRWQIVLNWPQDGEIRFGAVGFTQELLTEPQLRDTQSLTRRERDRLIGPGWPPS